MFNMVEEFDDGQCKLLFLTNPQADLIASSPGSVQKMPGALEVPKPSLVIELIMSKDGRSREISACERCERELATAASRS
jgi:hypothetical protein